MRRSWQRMLDQMPVIGIEESCRRRGCLRPRWRDGLCSRCWRLARYFGRDLDVFSREGVDGPGTVDRAARVRVQVELNRYRLQAQQRGLSVADALVEDFRATEIA